MAGQSAIDELWESSEGAPAPQLSDILAHIHQFLEAVGYTKTASALSKELARNDITLDTSSSDSQKAQILQLYKEWHANHQKHLTLSTSDSTSAGASDDSDSSSSSSDSDSDSSSSSSDSDSDDESERDEAEGVLVDVEVEESSDDDSDEESDSSEEDDESDSDSDDSSAASSVSSAKAGDKRKRASSDSSDEDSSDDSSSSDDSDSSDSDSDSDAPPAKKQKTASNSKNSEKADDSSDSDSSSDSDDSTSSDSSSSDDEKEEEVAAAKPQKTKKGKKPQNTPAVEISTSAEAGVQSKDAGSLSSATLDVDSSADVETPGQIHPDRLKQLPASHRTTNKKEVAELKKQQHIPFSRIPTDQKVDPRFSSNAYVSYDYADRAHRDLIVTKGKGFTKEKNKKKRGAYRGGAIDLTPKGIKFDD